MRALRIVERKVKSALKEENDWQLVPRRIPSTFSSEIDDSSDASRARVKKKERGDEGKKRMEER